jgi:hypothetical protein
VDRDGILFARCFLKVASRSHDFCFFNLPIAWEVDHESFFLVFENDGDGNDA